MGWCRNACFVRGRMVQNRVLQTNLLRYTFVDPSHVPLLPCLLGVTFILGAISRRAVDVRGNARMHVVRQDGWVSDTCQGSICDWRCSSAYVSRDMFSWRTQGSIGNRSLVKPLYVNIRFTTSMQQMGTQAPPSNNGSGRLDIHLSHFGVSMRLASRASHRAEGAWREPAYFTRKKWQNSRPSHGYRSARWSVGVHARGLQALRRPREMWTSRDGTWRAGEFDGQLPTQTMLIPQPLLPLSHTACRR